MIVWERVRDINPQLARRAHSARTASLPNPILFVNPSSPTYIILSFRLQEPELTVAEVGVEVLPEDVNYSMISKRISVCCARNIF